MYLPGGGYVLTSLASLFRTLFDDAEYESQMALTVAKNLSFIRSVGSHLIRIIKDSSKKLLFLVASIYSEVDVIIIYCNYISGPVSSVPS
jgi:hypothetical protein